MRLNPSISAALLVLAMAFSPVIVFAQITPASPAPQRESTKDLVARLTPEQKQQFQEAGRAFSEQHYAGALDIYKQLLAALPGDAMLSKLSSEAALNVGDAAFALATVKLVAQSDTDDWQAAALLVRACAESGDKSCRDAGMAHMLELHQRGVTPPSLQQYIVERVKAGENVLLIRSSLVPWGGYNVYALGQVIDSGGKIFLRVTIESIDADQALFAKQHPDEAAKGMRSFSLDSYRETGLNADGKRTQTHATYKFFVGQPPYDTIREEFINVATGKTTPLSNTTGVVVP
jgi:hypothetical protein